MSPWWSLTLVVGATAAAVTHLAARVLRQESRSVRAGARVVATTTDDLCRRPVR